MEFLEVMFMLQFIVVMLLFLFKLFNVFTGSRFTNINVSVITLIGFIIAWGTGLIVVLHDIGANLAFNSLFKLEAWLFALYFIFFLVELFFFYGQTITGQISRYTPERRR